MKKDKDTWIREKGADEKKKLKSEDGSMRLLIE